VKYAHSPIAIRFQQHVRHMGYFYDIFVVLFCFWSREGLEQHLGE